MKTGIYTTLSNEEYHGGPGISKSGLDLIHRSPMHFNYAKTAANDNTPTPAQEIGTALHMLVLEPALFISSYTLALRPSDVPDAIDSREALVAIAEKINADRHEMAKDTIKTRDEMAAMVDKLNETRLAKLPTTGTKADQIARIIAANREAGEEMTVAEVSALESLSGAGLKAYIETLNESRPGKLPTTGKLEELAQIYSRETGKEVLLFRDLCAGFEANNSAPYIIDTAANMADLAAAIRANGVPVKLWSEVKAEWLTNNGHRKVLDLETWDQVHAMRDAIMLHPAASALLKSDGVAEASAYWTDEATGELCRFRPDFWRADGVIADLKTTDDASPEGFAKSVYNWRYHVQAAYYTDGAQVVTQQQPKAFLFIAVEKKPPYAVGVYVLDNTSVEIGRAEYKADLARYAECKRTGQWAGYGDKIQQIELPGYALNKGAKLLEQA